ncbi:MAG: hypothetical protein GWO20_00640 [Candidatus Korarchaeota archaeon]|nr:hypothetical protein [Candidatus Korarchaeota archaeon]
MKYNPEALAQQFYETVLKKDWLLRIIQKEEKIRYHYINPANRAIGHTLWKATGLTENEISDWAFYPEGYNKDQLLKGELDLDFDGYGEISFKAVRTSIIITHEALCCTFDCKRRAHAQ